MQCVRIVTALGLVVLVTSQHSRYNPDETRTCINSIQFNLYFYSAVKIVRQQRRFGSVVWMELLMSLKAVSNKNVFKRFRKVE